MLCNHKKRITIAFIGEDFKLHETMSCYSMDLQELLSKGQKKLDALSIDELEGVNHYWIAQAQLTKFGEDIDTIK